MEHPALDILGSRIRVLSVATGVRQDVGAGSCAASEELPASKKLPASEELLPSLLPLEEATPISGLDLQLRPSGALQGIGLQPTVSLWRSTIRAIGKQSMPVSPPKDFAKRLIFP